MGLFDKQNPYKRETVKDSFDVYVKPGFRVISATWNRSSSIQTLDINDLVFHTEPFPEGYEPRTTVLNRIDITTNHWTSVNLIESKEEIH